MADRATSDDPDVQRQLDRLDRITPGRDILGRHRLLRLLARLGNPERVLPPVWHVAGTNGKGSVCTYLRGAFAAAGLRAHVYTSPHLVRMNERIRLANHLITDAALAAVLADVIDAVAGDETTFFEATTAAAFLAFSRTPADACIVEVGIGGRLDATNVLPTAVACGIAQLGLDHQSYLGNTLSDIAREKAGIAKPGVPLVTQAYPPAISASVAEVARTTGALVLAQGRDWFVKLRGSRVLYRDMHGEQVLPLPALAGEHQVSNAGLAVAMLRSQNVVAVPDEAVAAAMSDARWPARLSRLVPGPMLAGLPTTTQLWLDGAHNPAAMSAVVRFVRGLLTPGQPLSVIIGLLRDKDLKGVLRCFAGLPVTFYAVPIASRDIWAPAEIRQAALDLGFAALAEPDVASAIAAVARTTSPEESAVVLITGSLYLAGSVLFANNEIPE